MSYNWSLPSLLFFSSLFFAQNTAFSQTDTSRVIDLKEVKISVNRFEESAREQPAQIKQITKKDIAFQNAPNTADLLINSGDIFVQKSQGGGGSPVLRGFEASRVLLVVDGIRMNNAIYRSGHLQNVLRVDQAMLETTEVLFGPASLIYGSDALGGVISFNTKQPKLNTFSANAYARYGTAIQEKTGHVDFNIGGKKFASLTSVTASNFGDIIQGNWRRDEYPDFGKRFVYPRLESNLRDVAVTNPNVNKQVESGYSQLDLLQKFRYQNNANFEQTVNLQLSVTGNVPRYDRLSETNSAGNPTFGQWYYGPELRFLSAYELRIKNRRLFDDSSIKFGFQKIEESRNNRRFNSEDLFTQEEDVLIGSFNADFIKYAGENTYHYGIEYTINDVNSAAFISKLPSLSYGERFPTATRYPDGGSQMQTAAAYITAKNELVPDRLFVNYGVRYSFTHLQSK
ncbi:MAG: TonB-dependent receptor plug domain-containing protein, partial [Spirosomaceae bacterium]|nr:TonB-dependent receptor plug domain-containing protein [Spirosomataceae bacterium]